jgi:hypothetical protein
VVREDKLRSVDQSKAKIIAYIVVAGFMGIMLVFGLRSSSQAPLHEGDERRSITCKWCEGTGEVEGERCKHCLGAKKLKAIIPGPNHPLRIRGTVWNVGHFGSEEKAQEAAQKEDYEKVFLKTRPETAAQAKLVFKNSTAEVVIEAKASGRYWGYIVPGEYTLTVEHPNFKTFEQPFTVPVREHPIWPEIPGAEVEDEDQLELEIFLTHS